MQHRLNLPQPIVPIFWGLLLLEATFGAYLGVYPLWIERLGAPVAVVGFVLGAGGFLRLFVIIPAARIAERFGFRNTIVVARLFAVAGLLTAAAATHWTHLMFMVVGAAIGEMIFPLLQTLVAAEAGEENKMRSFALVFTIGPSVAMAISPLISGGMVALFGIRAAFVVAAFFSAISIFFLMQIQEPELVEHEDGSSARSYRAAIANKGVRLTLVLLMLMVFAMSLGIAFIPTFLEDVRGIEPAKIAAMSSLASVGSTVFGLAVARNRYLQLHPMIATALMISSMMTAFIIFRTAAWFPLIVIAFFFRGGFFSAWAMLLSIVGASSPASIRTRSFALLEMSGGIAFSLGPIIGGFLYATSETLPLEVAILLSLLLIPVFVVAERYWRPLWATDVEAALPEPQAANA